MSNESELKKAQMHFDAFGKQLRKNVAEKFEVEFNEKDKEDW